MHAHARTWIKTYMHIHTWGQQHIYTSSSLRTQHPPMLQMQVRGSPKSEVCKEWARRGTPSRGGRTPRSRPKFLHICIYIYIYIYIFLSLIETHTHTHTHTDTYTHTRRLLYAFHVFTGTWRYVHKYMRYTNARRFKKTPMQQKGTQSAYAYHTHIQLWESTKIQRHNTPIHIYCLCMPLKYQTHTNTYTPSLITGHNSTQNVYSLSKCAQNTLYWRIPIWATADMMVPQAEGCCPSHSLSGEAPSIPPFIRRHLSSGFSRVNIPQSWR